MEPLSVTAILGILGTLGTGAAWLIRRRDAKKDPIPKQAAELAIAQQALGIIQDAADFSRTDAQNLRADRDADRIRIAQLERDREEDRQRLTEADVRMDRLEALLSAAAAYIEALLRWAHIMPTLPDRPIPPLPVQLHELVDPQLWITTTPTKETP